MKKLEPMQINELFTLFVVFVIEESCEWSDKITHHQNRRRIS